MGLLRYQVFLTHAAVFAATWYYFLTKTPDASAWVTYAPIWAILVLGIFLFSRLVYGVLTYQDCPDAEREIDQQIVEARAEMKRRKVLE